MIKVEETLKYEYKNEEERAVHVLEMIEQGYRVVDKYTELDVSAYDHLFAVFYKQQKGLRGKNIYR